MESLVFTDFWSTQPIVSQMIGNPPRETRCRSSATAYCGASGAIMNSSRALIFAYSRDEYRDRYEESRWQAAVEAATRDMIDQLRDQTPAGKLVEK